MASISAGDLEKLTAILTSEIDDYAQLLPEPTVGTDAADAVAAAVASLAPRVLDYINSRLYRRYAAFASPLTDQVLTLTSFGLIGEFLYAAYRRQLLAEKAWADEWWQRMEHWLDTLASGKTGLADCPELGTATPVISGVERVFTGEEIAP